MPNLIDKNAAAEHLGTTVRHIQNLVYKREIPFVKVGHLVRFRTSDLDAWVEANTVAVSPHRNAPDVVRRRRRIIQP